MANFRYNCIDTQGKKVKGESKADSLDYLRQQLKSDGKLLIDAKESRNKQSTRANKLFNSENMLKSDEVSNLCRQLGIITSSGVSIVTSLETLIDQSSSKLMKSGLTKLYNGMQMGKTMAEIMSEQGSHFPELLAGMIATGESSGTLGTVFKSMADYYTRENLIKKKIKAALIYPALLSCMAVALVFGFLKFILPNLIEIITSNGTELPAVTKFVIWLSRVIGKYWLLIVAVVFILISVIKYWVGTEKGRLYKDTLLIRIPIINRAVRNIVTARFSQGVGLFVSSGFPLVQGLELLLKTTNNAIAEISIRNAISGIQQGESLVDNLGKGAFFDKLFIQMMAVGEQTGAMSKVTKEMSEHYERETELSISKATSLIEPVIMLIIGIVIGFLVVAVALPMFTIYSSIE